jgi:hypothetical protein
VKILSLIVLCATVSNLASGFQFGPRSFLLNHRLRVPARSGRTLCFTISRAAPVAIQGQFRAAGGTGNDIYVAIAEESEAINWADGHEARVLWVTESKRSAGNFQVDLDPGRYCIAFNNRFSAVSDKTVAVQADLVPRDLLRD